MRLKDNPFYMLSLHCSAGRREIAAAVEEKSFLLSPELCEQAQSILANPAKRLQAELDWLVDSDEVYINSIRGSIEKDSFIPQEGLPPLSELNVALHNMSVWEESYFFELGYTILDIDELYCKISKEQLEDLAKTINRNRERARMTSVSVLELSNAFGEKRADIRRSIVDRIDKLKATGEERDYLEYLELFRTMAQRYVSQLEYSDCVILSDLIDAYELSVQADIESSRKEVFELNEQVKSWAKDVSRIPAKLFSIEKNVTRWESLTAPMRIKSAACGLTYRGSDSIINKLRETARTLNSCGQAKHAAELSYAMAEIFSDFPNNASLFKSDGDTYKPKTSKPVYKPAKSNIDQMQEEIDYLDSIIAQFKNGTAPLNVNEYMLRLNRIYGKMFGMNLTSQEKFAVSNIICDMSRNLAVYLHNVQSRTEDALSILATLTNSFGPASGRMKKLENDLNILRREIAARRSGEAEKKRKKRQRLKNVVKLVTGIIAAILILRYCNSDSASKSNYVPPKSTPAPTYSPKPTVYLPPEQYIKNGTVLLTPDYYGVCPLSVKVGSSGNYYVYLKYISAPTITQENRSPSTSYPFRSDLAFYVSGNSSVELDVPIGIYRLYYAVGDKWYGSKHKFGSNTRYFSSDELLYFYADSQYYMGHTLELIPQYDGNFDTEAISEELFPE